MMRSSTRPSEEEDFSSFGISDETLEKRPEGAIQIPPRRIRSEENFIPPSLEDNNVHVANTQIEHAERMARILYPKMTLRTSESFGLGYGVPSIKKDFPMLEIPLDMESYYEKVGELKNFIHVHECVGSRVVLDNSPTGTGKTISALLMAALSGCPNIIALSIASMKEKWVQQAKSVGMDILVYGIDSLSRNNGKGFNGGDSLTEIIKTPIGDGSKSKTTMRTSKYFKRLAKEGVFIIADEASKLKTATSNRSKGFLAICDYINSGKRVSPRSRIIVASATLNDKEQNNTSFNSIFGIYGGKDVRGDTVMPYEAVRREFGKIDYDQNGLDNVRRIMTKIKSVRPELFYEGSNFKRIEERLEELHFNVKLSARMVTPICNDIMYNIIVNYFGSGMDPLPDPITYKLFMKELFSAKDKTKYERIFEETKNRFQELIDEGEKNLFLPILAESMYQMERIKMKYILNMILSVWERHPRRKFVVSFSSAKAAKECLELTKTLKGHKMKTFFVDGTVPIKNRPGIINDFTKTKKPAILICTYVLGMGQDINLTENTCGKEYRDYIHSEEYKIATPETFRDAENQITIILLPTYNGIDLAQAAARSTRHTTVGIPVVVIAHYDENINHLFNMVRDKVKTISEFAKEDSIPLEKAVIVKCSPNNFVTGIVENRGGLGSFDAGSEIVVSLLVYSPYFVRNDRRFTDRERFLRGCNKKLEVNFFSVCFLDKEKELHRVIIRTDLNVFFIRLVHMSIPSLKNLIKTYLRIIKSKVKIKEITDTFQFKELSSASDAVVPVDDSEMSCTSSASVPEYPTPYIEEFSDEVSYFAENYNFVYPYVCVPRKSD